MSARFQSKAGALIGAAVMLLTLVPTVAVGDNAAGSPDGLVVVIHPRNAVYEDAGVLVASVQNAYVFDFQLFTAGGQPYHVSKYMVDVHTVDGRAQPPGSSPFDSTLVWTRTFDLGDSYASAGTLRIPANVLTVRAPDGHEVPFFGGLTVTILPMLDENRQSLLDADFHYPAGQFSLPANEAAAQGDYARADQLDEGFTPVFITHGQLSGLLQYGNPVVNPGFEFFVCDEDTARAATDGNADCSNRPAPNEADADGKMAVPPWFIRADVPDANGDKVPCSIHHINGSSPEGAAAMSIHYKPCDNGRRLLLGQIISEPGAPLHWEGAQDSTVSFSLRIAGS
ncbi:MAG TPA: hypothetical protein VHH36_07940, partial [Candidatus Thermoplasmatota archaeon]|nr:hypothetical protein [Candidatus Thermoplasmatota archaeon]